MLILPNGLTSQQSKELTLEEMAWLAMGEEILPKLGLTLACPRCLLAGLKAGAVLQGANSPTDPLMTVTCGCRRLTYQTRQES